MALPSAVTLGAAALVFAAGVGLVAVEAVGDDDSTSQSSGTTTDPPEQNAPDPEQGQEQHERQEGSQPGDKPDKERKQRPRRERTEAVPRVFVEVYNNSGVTGLAADTAASLEDAGWNVAATDNWYGSIPDNTVYYPDGLRAEAKQLAGVLDYERLRPAVSPMQFDRLTVIITSS